MELHLKEQNSIVGMFIQESIVNKYLLTRFVTKNTGNSSHTHTRSLCRQPVLLIIMTAGWPVCQGIEDVLVTVLIT